MKEASTAITSINGIYRSMWTAGWSTTGNIHQSFGIAAYNLAQETMGDDLIMQFQGDGWFWYDQMLRCQEPVHILGVQVLRCLVRQLQVDRQRQQRHSGQGDDGRRLR